MKLRKAQRRLSDRRMKWDEMNESRRKGTTRPGSNKKPWPMGRKR